MTSSEEPALFVIEAVGDALGDDSDSDCDVPAFEIAAFRKYNTLESDNLDQIVADSSKDKGKKEEKHSHLYVNVYPNSETALDRLSRQKETLKNEIKRMDQKNLVAQPGFVTGEKVPTFLSRRQSRKLGLKEKEKTKGFHWYNMSAPEMTEEKKNDLTVVKMRKALDPKHFYKRSALKTDGDPKYFQVGTFNDSPLDFYSSRIPKKQRKQTLVDELMADAQFRSYQKKKMSEIIRNQPKKFHHRKNSKTSKHKETKANISVKKQKKNK